MPYVDNCCKSYLYVAACSCSVCVISNGLSRLVPGVENEILRGTSKLICICIDRKISGVDGLDRCLVMSTCFCCSCVNSVFYNYYL